MSFTSILKNLKRRIVTFLTVPRQHEDPYVNAILNVKVSKEEVEQTLNLLLVNPRKRSWTLTTNTDYLPAKFFSIKHPVGHL